MKEVTYDGPGSQAEEESWKAKKFAHEDATALPYLRTYQADIETFLQTAQVTKTQIAIAEQKRREARGEKLVQVSPHLGLLSRIMLGIGVLLFVAGIAFVTYALHAQSSLLALPKNIPWKLLVSGEAPKVIRALDPKGELHLIPAADQQK